MKSAKCKFSEKTWFIFQFDIWYQFTFLKWGLINPSRPPFFKGRRAFLEAFDKRFLFFPPVEWLQA